jgi:hypothetical protein
MQYMIKSPAEFGRLVGITDRAYTRLAMFACEQAAKGRYSFEDAGKILIEFNEARRAAAGQSRMAEHPGKAQVSKFARCVALGETFGDAALPMLEEVSNLHANEFIKQKYEGRLRYNGEYNALVEAAREAVKTGRLLSRKEIISLLVKS